MRPPATMWNDDALAALDSAGLSRRGFLKSSGALIVGFSALGRTTAAVYGQGINGAGNDDLDAWIAIRADGGVTAYTGKCELGHGLFTAQTQLIAEELGVAFDRVTLIQCDTEFDARPGNDFGCAVAPSQLQSRQSGIGGGHGTRSAGGTCRE